MLGREGGKREGERMVQNGWWLAAGVSRGGNGTSVAWDPVLRTSRLFR